jgi:hypothetical protein
MRFRVLEAVWETTEAVPLRPLPAISKRPEVSVSKVGVLRVHAAPWGSTKIICQQQPHQTLRRHYWPWRWVAPGLQCPQCTRLSSRGHG